MSTQDQALPSDLRYADAVAELKTLLAAIEGEETELDDLASQVQRAALLIAFCRDRIEKTEMSVNKVFEDMASEDET
jgi:exodeoxyribonuclease VII small subunit